MAQMVTIEGSVTPSAELARGERRTVIYTDRIARLVKRGFIVIVKGPIDASEIAKGTGVPNVGHELPADGQMHDISLPGAEPETPLAQVVPDVPQHPDEYAQHDVHADPPPVPLFPAGWQADAPEAVVDNDPKAPVTGESGTGG